MQCDVIGKVIEWYKNGNDFGGRGTRQLGLEVLFVICRLDAVQLKDKIYPSCVSIGAAYTHWIGDLISHLLSPNTLFQKMTDDKFDGLIECVRRFYVNDSVVDKFIAIVKDIQGISFSFFSVFLI